jgi:predicted Zn finger-like uncharacterized protein
VGDSIQFNCPGCQTTLAVPESLGGKLVKCQKCQGLFVAPPKQRNVVSALETNLDDDLEVSTYAKPNTKYCHYCGAIIASLAESCPKCGVRQPDQPSRGSHGGSGSPNKVAAWLFAIFLGLFGAHRFYLGQSTMGVLYLLMNILLFWTVVVPVVFAIICLIEGLVYLTYTDSDFAEKYARE